MTNKTVKSVCPYCGVGCGIVMQVAGNRVVKVIGDKTHPANFGRLCTKGNTCGQVITESGRMESAYVRNRQTGSQVPVAMHDAITQTAGRLRQILDTHGPDAIAFYVSGQMSLEAQYLANKLAKGFIRTQHIESNSRLCMASASSGYKLSLGADGPPGSYQDFDKADLFFVIGANMADCHPILFLRMMDRVKAGAKLIVVDPRRSATAEKADLFLQIKPGTDLALLNGLLHLLVKNDQIDLTFIAKHTQGWDDMPAFLNAYAPEKVSAITGIPQADIEQAALWIGEAREWMSCWTMGINQSTHGTWNTNAICNLHLATGAICRPGSGPFSLTGQPNAMGGREVGYMGPGLPGQRSTTADSDRAFVEQMWQLAPGTLRKTGGGGTVAMFDDMKTGKIKACWIICTNPVASMANRSNVIEGLKAAELVIAQDAFLDTETNIYADVLLPGALWAEADGVMINSERNLTLMQQAVCPPGDAMADWAIIARIACEMGFADGFSYQSAAEIFDEIRGAWNPKTGYDIRGASYERLRQGPMQWPCAPDQPHARNPIRYLNNGVSQTLKTKKNEDSPAIVFATETGRAVFLARPHMPPAELPDSAYPFVLNTGRLQHQWHTLTKTGKITTLNKLNPGPFIEIHPEDASILGIDNKDHVQLRSRRGKAILPAKITDRVRTGNCFSPFHWNDVFGDDLAVNALTNDAVDPISLQPEFKFCAVALTRIDQPGETIPATVLPKNATEHHAGNDVKANDMNSIDRFSQMLGLEAAVEPELTPVEKLYLQGFIQGMKLDAGEGLLAVPALPPGAPIEPSRRILLDGILAGLFCRTGAHAAVGPVEPLQSAASIAILWATQTGNAENFAARCAERLKAENYAVTLSSMNAFGVDRLKNIERVLFIASSFGDGDPAESGDVFWRDLQTDHAPQLEAMQYAVLALGDSNYNQFCGFGRNLDARLEMLGARRLVQRADCEPEYEDLANIWLENTVKALAGVSASAEVRALVPAGGITERNPTTVTYSRHQPLRTQLKINRLLSHEGSSKETRQIVFDIAGTGLEYEAGDALGVWPVNCPGLVADILTALKWHGEHIVSVKEAGDMPVAEALTKHYEIARITPGLLQFIVGRTGSDALAELSKPEKKAALKDWLWGRQIIDLLTAFPIDVLPAELLPVLKRLQPRFYSIASSPKVHAEEIHLTISTVRYNCEGEPRSGVCSTFLADRADAADIGVFLQKASHFRVPQNKALPLIMVGPGTGISPFRAFLHERKATGATGKNWLFFGEQRAAYDFYYRDELEAMQTAGILSRLDTAFSRDQAEKIYVQHRMIEQGAELWRWLEAGAHFYVCGDASRMAKDVDSALKEIIQTHGGLSSQAADQYVQKMSADKRYGKDVY
ncbi:MAG: sulfite reductase subunit alpha [Rhodospirillales bacterium]|nr:sulfite reductase subunit alpha [Rhodospirillales bacterium]